ncbi:hypothetical protein OA501_00320, partial [Flavobacteriaceae bacterium]|nr:hypothetical protein [Flavobacteriaceae bacterium]
MKKILPILFLLLQLKTYAQGNSKWNLGMVYSVENLTINNGQNNDYLVTQGNINGYGIEFDKNNYTLGLSTQFFINKKISLSAGLLYSSKDFTGTFNCATCESTTYPIYSPEIITQRFLV